jgi:pyridoxal 5'-phosphate synthase pdxT subunit
MVKPRTIGVLGLQGDFSLHRNSLERLGASAPKIRRPAELESCDGLVVPGGESTTFGKMLRETGLYEAIRSFAETRPVMGTCAGLIALATRISNDGLEALGLIDVEVERNAYGRQVDSFVAGVRVPALGGAPEFEGVFIRAPKIRSIGKGTEAVGFLGQDPVMVRNERILAMTFHPELTDDLRIHLYFIEEFAGGKK